MVWSENERIRELADLCENWYEVEDGMLDMEFHYDKFAKLLIQECIGEIYAAGEDYTLAVDNIRNRFGVK